MTPTPVPSATPTATGAPGPRARLAALVDGVRRGSLADGLSMSLAAGGAAAVGMVSWIVAARSLTPAELGVATAFVSAFLLIAGCSELNLGVGLLRWLPRAGGASRVLLRRASTAVTAVAAAAASAYLLLPDASLLVDAVSGGGAAGEPTGTPRWVGAAVFVLAAVLWAVFQQQDFVLVGLGRSWWAPARVALFAVGRLGILLVAGASLTAEWVVASWVVPTAACVALVWLQGRRVTATLRDDPATLPPRRAVVAFLGPTYVGQLATAILFNQVPLLITFRFGPATGAAFFLVWQAVTVVDVVARYFVTSLSAAVAREPGRAAEHSRRTRRRLLCFLLPMLAVGAAAAGTALSLFGPEYVREAPVLQIMLGCLALRLLVVHRLGEHQAMGRGVPFAALSVLNTGLVVAVAVLVPADAQEPLVVTALGFVVAQACCAAFVLFPRSLHRVRGAAGRRGEGTGGIRCEAAGTTAGAEEERGR